MLRWNAILLLLAVLLALDAILIMSRDINFSSTRDALLREAGMVPRPGEQTHVHLAARTKNKITDTEVDEHPGGTGATAEDEEEGEEDDEEEGPEKGGDKSKKGHQIAGLNCDAYGGPTEEDAAEMVYWQDIPTDSKHVSPLKASGPEPKYLTFEPDEGKIPCVFGLGSIVSMRETNGFSAQ